MEKTNNQNDDVFFMSDALVGVFDPEDLIDSRALPEKKETEFTGLRFVSYSKEKSQITVSAGKKFVKSAIITPGFQSFKKKFFGLEFEMTNEILEVCAMPDDTDILVTLKVVQIREV